MRFLIGLFFILALHTSYHCGPMVKESPSFLAISDLPENDKILDPRAGAGELPVMTVGAWETQRKPEIQRLFAHYMYGVMPAPPAEVVSNVDLFDPNYLEGTATKKQITLRLGPSAVPAIELLLVLPNDVSGPVPVFLGLNFYGNHSVLDDDSIPLTTRWVPERGEGVVDNRATEATRGTSSERWPIREAIARGYAVATLYHGDLDPDKDDFSDGIHPHFQVHGTTERRDESWGAIAAWAWGLHRAVDYLLTDPDIDGEKIAVMGHSRNGKAALLAGATDDRIALVVSNQSGCGGGGPEQAQGRRDRESDQRPLSPLV